MELKKKSTSIAQEYEIPQGTLAVIIKNKTVILQFGAQIQYRTSFK